MYDPLQKLPLLTSLGHPELRAIQALAQRDHRDAVRKFYTEGARFVVRAAASGIVSTCVVAAPRGIANEVAVRLRSAGIRVLRVTPEVLRALGHGADPQGIGAVVHQPWATLGRVTPVRAAPVVALREIQSGGNLGTILRTADAASCGAVILVGDSIDPFDPRVVRASMGSIFGVPIIRASMRELLAWQEKHGASLVGTSPAASVCYREADYSRPTVLFLGWERKGLASRDIARCDQVVAIPMAGGVDSLNVAVAAGVLLFEAAARSRG